MAMKPSVQAVIPCSTLLLSMCFMSPNTVVFLYLCRMLPTHARNKRQLARGHPKMAAQLIQRVRRAHRKASSNPLRITRSFPALLFQHPAPLSARQVFLLAPRSIH
ncbi:hypothetical protein K402DRAFT_126094 [Aulographum hederae CBS 113979]|uniref:Uncharacterized protein n=1 Tax=Aulographum hederae CBS 113979 TaxID=1176131 RepID=A0A6G1HE32_9PEZI|nr:hypothetical protein K402DRAFT_126094 [Aulographum hederae CBS 113979]